MRLQHILKFGGAGVERTDERREIVFDAEGAGIGGHRGEEGYDQKFFINFMAFLNFLLYCRAE